MNIFERNNKNRFYIQDQREPQNYKTLWDKIRAIITTLKVKLRQSEVRILNCR